MVVELVDKGMIGKYHYAAFEVTPDELEKYIPEARESVAEWFEEFLAPDLPEDIRREIAEEVRTGKRDLYSALNARDLVDEMPEFYFGDVEEIAAQMLMERLLKEYVPEAPDDPQVNEEPGYGVPEYSLYFNLDVRSWSGKWWWSGAFDTVDICFGFISDEETYNKIHELLERLNEKAKKKGRLLFFAIWRYAWEK